MGSNVQLQMKIVKSDVCVVEHCTESCLGEERNQIDSKYILNYSRPHFVHNIHILQPESVRSQM